MTQHLPPAADAVDLLRGLPLTAMRQRRQWVGFKIIPTAGAKKPKKLPVVATAPDAKADSTKPRTWRTFDDAMKGLVGGNYTAAGYALDGDIVGIDLDGERWVVGEGELSEEAQVIVDRCGSYAEWSISNHGLHILLHGRLARGRKDRQIGVEVYTRKRFFITTGRRLAEAPSVMNENQAAINWLLERYFDGDGSTESAETTEGPEIAESTEVMTSGFSGISAVSGISGISVEPAEIIRRTLPSKMGERNNCIFDLARGLKFNSGLREAKPEALKALVRTWHRQALPVIGTKAFDETWADFLRAWGCAAIPLECDLQEWAATMAKSHPAPGAADYETPAIQLLVGICWHLATLNRNGRFFASSHKLGQLLGVSHDKALDWLRMLCTDGVLEITEHGNKRRATRYRWRRPRP